MSRVWDMGFGGGDDLFGYTDDGDGRLLNDGAKSYLWEMQGWLCGVTSAGNHYQYIYDAEGRLVTTASRPDAQCGLNTTTLADYVVDQFGRQITEADGSARWRHTNVYADGELLATYDSAGLHYALNDWLGDKRVQALASSTGTTVEETCWNLPFNDGFGCSGTGTDATEQHYTGKEHDKYASQLDHLGARSYTGYSARFLSPDPTQLYYADPANPQSFNLYSYVRNNPLTNIDPTGLDCENGEGMDLGQGGGDLDPCPGYDGPEDPGGSGDPGDGGPGDPGGDSGYGGDMGYGGDGGYFAGPVVQTTTNPDGTYTIKVNARGLPWCFSSIWGCGGYATTSFSGPGWLIPGVTTQTPATPPSGGGGGGGGGSAPSNGQVPVHGIWTYGNWCGAGGSGTPINATDAACQQHDACYNNINLTADQYTSGNLTPGQVQGAKGCNQQLCNAALNVNRGSGIPFSQRWAGAEIILFFSLTGPQGARCQGF